MEPVSVFLVVIAAILLIGIAGELLFARIGVPDVIWLIVVGILAGPVFGLVSNRQLQAIAPYFGAITLVVVLFDGGAELRIAELTKAAGRGTLLALVGFTLSVLILTLGTYVAHLLGITPSGWGWLHFILVGTILGGSSSVVIMPALKLAGLSSRLSNLVNYESALTDVLSVVATGACIAMAQASGATQSGAGSAAIMLAKKFGIGLGVGILVGFLSIFFLRSLRRSQYAYPAILGMLLLLYVLVGELEGSSALGILAAAVMVGNAPSLSRVIGLEKTARLGRNVESVHDQITFIIKSFFFVFIGAMLGPPWTLLLFGLALGFLLLLARLPAIRIATAGSNFSPPSKTLLAVLFPRGMAAGVLAIMPHQARIPETQELPVIVFSAVLTTILIFAIGFPLLKGKLPASDLAGRHAVGSAAKPKEIKLAKNLQGAAAETAGTFGMETTLHNDSDTRPENE